MLKKNKFLVIIAMMLLTTLVSCLATVPIGGKAECKAECGEGGEWDSLWESLRKMGVPEEVVEVARDLAHLPFKEAREKYNIKPFAARLNMTIEEFTRIFLRDDELPKGTRRAVSWDSPWERVNGKIRIWSVGRTEGCNLIRISWHKLNAEELERRPRYPTGKPIIAKPLRWIIVDLALCEVQVRR